MNNIKRTFGSLYLIFLCCISCQKLNNPQIKTIIADDPFKIEMVYIPAGDLEWGTKSPQNVMIRHAMTVHIDAFYIGKYEVTQEQWKAVMGSYPVLFDWDSLPPNFDCDWTRQPIIKQLSEPTGFLGDNLPVEVISWNAAQDFCKKLSKKTGHTYRLPTKAEWEYACRAGGDGPYHFGNDTTRLGEFEWFVENSEGRPHPVGMKKPNPWGLYDISGNVAEWTSTIADMYPYTLLYPGRDFGPDISRVYKGSHYQHNKYAALIEYSHTYQQALPRGPVGLRVLRVVD